MTMFLYISGVIVILLCLIAIFFVTKNEKLTMLVYKINMCEKEIDDILKNKEDLSLRLINIINREIKKDYKNFDEVKNIKSIADNNPDKDKILTNAYIDIKSIFDDNNSLKDVKSFDGILKDIEFNEIQLVSLRTLYNKCANDFNIIYKKFPFNLLCKIKKFKVRKLYSGKELNDIIEKELNVTV